MPPGELEVARIVAGEIGSEHVLLDTCEMDDPRFVANPSNRCYYCKTALASVLVHHARKVNADLLVEGTNYSDITSGDHRPGHQAMLEARFRSPFVEAKITKRDIRELALRWSLSVANKPAMACLSSRFPPGARHSST